MNRRDFFKMFAPGFQPVRHSSPPNHFSLADLPDLPDEQFLYLIPTFRGGLKISVGDRLLDIREGGSAALIASLSLTDLEERVAVSIDGIHSIRRITLTVGKAVGVTPVEIYPTVRDLFLRLARQGFVHPVEPPSPAVRKN